MAEEIKKEITKPSGKKFTLQVTYEPYARYEQKAPRRLTIHAKSEKGLLMALADNLGLNIDSEEIEEDEDFNVQKYIDEIEDGNGDGCDWISRLSINGKVYIDEVGEDEDQEITVDESCVVKESEKMASKLDKEADKQVSTATKSLVSSDEIKDKEAQKILDKIHQYNGEDKVNEAVDTKGVTVGPFTSEETKKYSSELNDFCKQKDPDAYFETYWDVDFNHHNEPVISVDINWGDWKHEHLWFNELARQFFESKNIEIKIDTNVTEEDGSNTYSATHVIHKVGPSVTELTGDDAGNNVIMIKAKAKDTITPVNEEEESHWPTDENPEDDDNEQYVYQFPQEFRAPEILKDIKENTFLDILDDRMENESEDNDICLQGSKGDLRNFAYAYDYELNPDYLCPVDDFGWMYINVDNESMGITEKLNVIKKPLNSIPKKKESKKK